MSQADNAKKEVRKQVKEINMQMTPEYKKAASDIIAEKCIKHPAFIGADSIFIFVSMPTEPDTAKIIDKAFELGKKVYVPRCLGGGIMEAIRLTSMDDLVPGYYDILEPKAEIGPTAVSEFDSESAVAFVPCVAAARDGQRLGHGAGYYDRFLEGRKMKKLMLVYGRQLLDDVPCDEHDIVMDEVVFEG